MAKKQKITYIATLDGIKKAEKALIRLGFGSRANFIKSTGLSKSTIDKFFRRQGIQLDSFERICETLTFSDWRDIAEMPIEDKITDLIEGIKEAPLKSFLVNQQVQAMVMRGRKVTIVDETNGTIKAVIKLTGDINSAPNIEILTSILKEYSGDSITITDIQSGSIKLFIEGSQEDIERILFLIKSGELKEIEDFPIENIQILNESPEDEESSKQKWRLVEEIHNKSVKQRNLSNADLSDTNLNNAYLVLANLYNADLSNSDLTNADLSGADLSNADLSGADLWDANLSGADLSNADLSNANLHYANLGGADLSGAFLYGAKMKRIDLRKTRIDGKTKLDDKSRLIHKIINQGTVDKNLNYANLSSTDLTHADLSGAFLHGANLSSVNLTRANLSSTDLTHADLSGAFLNATDLSGSNLSDADLSNADLTGAFLNGANLSDADLRRADLSNADLTGAFLNGANLSDVNLTYAFLIHANLVRTNLSNAFLFHVNLMGANLISANLSGANLSAANLINAKLNNVNLDNVQINKTRFGSNLGISKEMKQDLIERGAIFEDSPGDRSGMLSS